MIDHPKQYCQILDDCDVTKILETSYEILLKKGMLIQSDFACKALAQAGAKVDMASQHVIFPTEMVQKFIKMAPSKFTLHARNPEKNVEIGTNKMATAPGYGSAFIANSKGQRRNATMQDFDNFAKLSCSSDIIDLTGGLLVEPDDVPMKLRSLEMTLSLISNSDKHFMGMVTSKEDALQSIEMAKILFGNIENKAVLTALVNINSPLRLDRSMADSLIAYAQHNQPIILTPGILMGVTAPVTTAAALAQAFAELLGCVTLIQIIKTGSPVIIGLGGFGSDLRNCSTGFGRPENALASLAGAQIARLLKIPFRCTAAATSSRKSDCQAGYEHMMTALSAQNAGVHFCLQALGILDSINIMSYEQFMIDIEIWSYIKRLSQQVETNDEMLDIDMISLQQDNFLFHEKTIKFMRKEIFTPTLIDPQSYESWFASNGDQDIIKKARSQAKKVLKTARPKPLDKETEKELFKYAQKKRIILAKKI